MKKGGEYLPLQNKYKQESEGSYWQMYRVNIS
jgi:hypothetical protein